MTRRTRFCRPCVLTLDDGLERGQVPALFALRAVHAPAPFGVVRVVERRWSRPIMTHAPLRPPRAEPSVMGMPDTAGRETQDARHWTRAAVLALPDDAQRHELIGGEHIVTPAPAALHQRAVAALYLRLSAWLSAHPVAHVLFSPADISLGEDE